MGKSKSANPAEAYRKAQRKKELAKNKEARKKTRELVNVRKDTAPLEDEIREIEAKPTLDGKDKTRLSNLRSELNKLRKAKEEYVKEHPEHRKLVYGGSSAKQSRESDVGDNRPAGGAVRQPFGKDGLPLYPEHSINYDPASNRMPYMERPIPPDAMEEDDEESDDDVVMPEGPAPNADMSDLDDSDSDDDIPMPPGPPPPRNAPPLPKGPPPLQTLPPPPPMFMSIPPGVPPLPMENLVGSAGLPFPPPPPGFGTIPPPPGFGTIPPPPLGFAIAAANLPPGAIPGPPMGLPPFPPNLPPPPHPPTNSRDRPHNPRYRGPPPGVYDPMTPFPFRVLPPPPPPQSTSSLPPPPPHLPPRPSGAPPPPLPTSATAVISAEPELRDFKKEATSFVPRQAKKIAKGNSRVNATPDTGDSTPAEARPDLMKSLEGAGVSIPKQPATGMTQKKASAKVEARDDYDKFMDDMGDFLKQ